MTLRIALAWFHLLALAVGLSGVWARGRALRDFVGRPDDRGALRRALIADTWWGIAAVVWLVTGLWRVLAGTEKNTSYYVSNHAFWLKMALFLSVAALEIWPMMTLIRWRRGAVPTHRDVGRIEIVSYVECALVACIALAAVSMARGLGVATRDPAGDSPISATVDDDPTALAPTGTETVTDSDLATLTQELAMPLDGIDAATLHSSFSDLRGGGSRPHEALDIMAPRRTPIKSAAKGRVLKLFNSRAGGLMVYAADSSERFILLYGHLDGYAPALHDGAALERGQVIGYVGSTGNASANAPHLHFAVARSADVKQWSKGKPIDPLPPLQAAVRAK